MDAELIRELPEIVTCRNNNELSDKIENWVNKLANLHFAPMVKWKMYSELQINHPTGTFLIVKFSSVLLLRNCHIYNITEIRPVYLVFPALRDIMRKSSLIH